MKNDVNRAFMFALDVHAKQTRKDGKPYITHPFSVAYQLAKNGADDDLICAGLLHDVVEDGKVAPEEIRSAFGDEVLRIVLFDTEDKTLSWRQRKEKTIDALKNCDLKCAMLICADKLSNLLDIKDSLEKIGDDVWKSFKCGKKEQEWLYRECVDALSYLSRLKMYRDLKLTVEEVFS